MAVTFIQNRVWDDGVNGPSAGAVGFISRAFTSNVAAGNLLLVWVWAGINSTDDTQLWRITDTRGNSYTRFSHSSETAFNPGGSTGSKQCLYATIANGSGANTVTATFNINVNYTRIAIWEYIGSGSSPSSAVASSVADSAAHNSGVTSANGIVMPAVTSVVNGIVGSATQDLSGGGSYTAGTGYGNFLATADDGFAATEDKITTTASSTQPTFTSLHASGNGHFGMSWVLAPVAAGGGDDPVFGVAGRGAGW